jgi:hypothetical protein
MHWRDAALSAWRDTGYLKEFTLLPHESPPPSLHPTGQATSGADTRGLAGIINTFGVILAISYPVLALSTGVRAGYQLLLRDDITYYLPSLMSLVAALCYLIAAIGFAHRRRWSWYLSVSMLGFEMLMVLLIGTLSFVYPDMIGRTVWRHFGADYGYFPLFQPLLGLIWLFWPDTVRAYGLTKQEISPQRRRGGTEDAEI